MDADTLVCSGRWSVGDISSLRAGLDTLGLPQGGTLKINGKAISALDSAGAWLVLQVRQRMTASGAEILLEDFTPEHRRLIDYISTEGEITTAVAPRQTGRSLVEPCLAVGHDLVHFLAFIGEVVVSLLRGLRRPARVRWAEVFEDIYQSGVKALPSSDCCPF